jgi:hypothetical protein
LYKKEGGGGGREEVVKDWQCLLDKTNGVPGKFAPAGTSWGQIEFREKDEQLD